MSRLSALLALLLAAPAAALEVEVLTVPQGVASGQGIGAPKTVEVVRGEALVRFATATATGQKQALLAGMGGLYHRDLDGTGWSHVSLPDGMSVAQGLQALAALPGVLAAEPNHAFRAVRAVNDPLASSQYGLTQIQAQQAWDYEVGSSSRVTVAVVDSGIETTHPDLTGRLVGNNQFCDPGANKDSGADNTACVNGGATTACHHGTRVAGIAAATGDNATAVAGVAFGARLVSLKIFRDADCLADCSNAACATDSTAIADAINYARVNNNDATYGRIVLNMSIGGAAACSGALQTAVTNAVTAGVVLVAASGNDGGAVQSPANCSGVIPVGAVNASGDLAAFSSRGPELASGGLVAPGVSIVTTDTGAGTTGSATGTSFAAPHAAGAAALVLAAKPTFTPAQVLATLRNSADPVGFGALAAPAGFKTQGNASGAGRLNAFAAMRLAVTGQLADFQGEEKVVAFPNPFRADRHQSVSFAFPPSLQGASDVTIKIYGMDGSFVRELNSLVWNTKNENGRFVASGTYLFVVSTSRGKKTGRVSVLR
ncbi:MAG: S8 family serine peptidase [Elusimicrobiota bacterium]|nr:S8 family serine peptidase [Elusimicrobiota bacterium]